MTRPCKLCQRDTSLDGCPWENGPRRRLALGCAVGHGRGEVSQARLHVTSNLTDRDVTASNRTTSAVRLVTWTSAISQQDCSGGGSGIVKRPSLIYISTARVPARRQQMAAGLVPVLGRGRCSLPPSKSLWSDPCALGNGHDDWGFSAPRRESPLRRPGACISPTQAPADLHQVWTLPRIAATEKLIETPHMSFVISCGAA